MAETLGCCQRDRARLVEAFDGLCTELDALERKVCAEMVKNERLLDALEGVEAQVRYARAAMHGRL